MPLLYKVQLLHKIFHSSTHPSHVLFRPATGEGDARARRGFGRRPLRSPRRCKELPFPSLPPSPPSGCSPRPDDPDGGPESSAASPSPSAEAPPIGASAERCRDETPPSAAPALCQALPELLPPPLSTATKSGLPDLHRRRIRPPRPPPPLDPSSPTPTADGSGLPDPIVNGSGLLLCKLFFAVALALSAVREAAERRLWCTLPYIPSTVSVAVAFFMPPKMPVGMAVGSLALHIWKRYIDDDDALLLSPAVASGLICGDGLGSLLSSILTFFRARPPICIKFLTRDDNNKLDTFLATIHARAS